MNNKKSNRIYWRSVISFYILISFIVMSISGIILFFAPPGRVAHWSEWTFVALSKEQWQSVHTIFTFVFVFAIAFHIYFNWKVIITYLKSRMGEGMRRRNELILASVFSLLVVVLTIANIPPFSAVMVFGEDLSESWSDENSEPPVPHAELLTLSEFAKVINVGKDQLLTELKSNGLKVPSDTVTVIELAEFNNTTPQNVYKSVQSKDNKVTLVEGTGYGRKSIKQISKDLNIDLAIVLDRLKEKGINAAPDDKIRDLARENDISPIELIKLIQL